MTFATLIRTTYAGVIQKPEQFAGRLYVEAWKRGWSAEEEVFIGDGAEWIWNIAR